MAQPGDVLGGFELLREVGRGAMGVVYEATQRSLSRRVAVKVLAPRAAGDPVWVERFRVEANAAARLSHPGILGGDAEPPDVPWRRGPLPSEGVIDPARPIAADSPACRRALRATDFVLAGWLLYLAYESLHDLSAATAHWALAQGLVEILVAALVLARPPPTAIRLDPLSVASVIVSNWHFFAFDFTLEGPDLAGVLGAALVVAAVYVGAWARLTLGRTFAILPAVRTLKTGGPYRFVRHPIYLALIVTDVGLVIAHPSWRNALVALTASVAHVVRVFREESLWLARSGYRVYTRRTRFRLVPYVF